MQEGLRKDERGIHMISDAFLFFHAVFQELLWHVFLFDYMALPVFPRHFLFPDLHNKDELFIISLITTDES